MTRHRAPGGRSVAAALLIVALATAGIVTSASGSNVARVNAASWNSSTPATAISATVYVSAVNCRAVRPGTFVGQESGIELTGTYNSVDETAHPADFAGVYTYCAGHRPQYKAQFVIANVHLGRVSITPALVAGPPAARLKVAPGDPLQLSIVSSAAGLTLRIRDVNTAKIASLNAPGIGRRSGWSAGTLPIFASSSGAPKLRGSLELVQKYSPTGGPATIPGPAAFPPVVFDRLLVDHSSPSAISARGVCVEMAREQRQARCRGHLAAARKLHHRARAHQEARALQEVRRRPRLRHGVDQASGHQWL